MISVAVDAIPDMEPSVLGPTSPDNSTTDDALWRVVYYCSGLPASTASCDSHA